MLKEIEEEKEEIMEVDDNKQKKIVEETLRHCNKETLSVQKDVKAYHEQEMNFIHNLPREMIDLLKRNSNQSTR